MGVIICSAEFFCYFCGMETKAVKLSSRGARGGFFLGAWFVATFAMLVASSHLALLSLPALLMMAGVPVMVYYALRRSYRSVYGLTTLSALWLEGIMMFIGASLFLAVAAFIFFRYIEPGYVASQVSQMAEYYSTSDNPELQQMGATLSQMVDNHLLPRPIECAITMAWLGAFTGAVTSLILAAIAKWRGYTSNN